jgi:hypothetical protein
MSAARRGGGEPVVGDCVPGERGVRRLQSLEGAIRMAELPKDIDAMEPAIGKPQRHLRAREEAR